ncbi:MAG: lipase [Clostridiales bacterium]|nr:lipase [Clostridiales bacterium]
MKWVTVWGNATSVAEHRPAEYAKNITLRYPIKCAFGGKKIRLHFSNYCGTEPVTFNRVTVATAVSDREIDLKDATVVTFGGSQTVTIPAGEEIFSDEMEFFVTPMGSISVSIYLKDFTLMRSGVIITGPLSKGFFSVGDQTFAEVLPLNYTRSNQSFYFLTGVDLFTKKSNRAVICYGDSITSQSWPDYLAQACMDNPYNRTAIIRRAASGTRILRQYSCITYESYGLCGKNRFEREISTVSGADTVIIQQGINDIIHPVGTDVNPFRPMSDLPTVEELEEGMKYYLSIAKSYGLKTMVGTLLPIGGWRTYAPFREDMKNAFNDWIKTQSVSDDFIDFESKLIMENGCSFKYEYDSGDHLHPSELAYKLMAKLAYEKIKE